MTPSLRTLRLRGVWLLIVPFALMARPTPALLATGGALAALGVLLRGWAAGFIHKDRALSTRGPYAHTRNPLYLGSFLIGLGVAVAAGRWQLTLLFLVFFAALYAPLVREEARALELRFGDAYVRWASEVPLFLPRLTAARGEAALESADAEQRAGSRFTFERWRRNREYEAALGVAAGFLFLAARLLLG